MPRVLLLLTFLNAGVVAANPTAGRWNVSAFRRRAAGRRRPIEAEDVFRISRVSSTRDFRDVEDS